MNKLLLFIGLALANGREVDPFIGTLGTGHTFPGATFPFGKVQLSPDTNPEGWQYCSGYRHGDDITRISHTHLSGTGGGDGYDIGITFEPIRPINEIAYPGYYELQGNKNENIKLTVSKHCGWSKFTNVRPQLDLIRGYNGDKHIDSAATIDESNIISGYRTSKGWASHTVYFSLFQKENNIIVCISHSDAKEALKHIRSEMDKSFDSVLRETTREWNKHLSLLLGKPILQTALYHTLIHPSLYNETQYTIFSTWDTYRAWNTLMTILYPEYIQNFTQSMMRSKYLPVWELWGDDTLMMGGTHSISMIGEYVLKGLVPIDLVWDKIQVSLQRPDRYYDEYYERGYISEESSEVSGSMTLEHSYTDNVLQRIQDKYNLTSRRNFQPTSFTKLFDVIMFKPRFKDGSFKQTFLSKAHINNGYKIRSNGFQEGSAETYRFMAAHDFKTLLSLYQSDTDGCSKYYPCENRKDGEFTPLHI
jgi:putative alpha-1,2-mannosidase